MFRVLQSYAGGSGKFSQREDRENNSLWYLSKLSCSRLKGKMLSVAQQVFAMPEFSCAGFEGLASSSSSSSGYQNSGNLINLYFPYRYYSLPNLALSPLSLPLQRQKRSTIFPTRTHKLGSPPLTRLSLKTVFDAM